MVGKAGFEPATPCSQSRCSSQLSYVGHDERVDVDSLELSTNFFINVTRDMLG